jgi:hypothetical protein
MRPPFKPATRLSLGFHHKFIFLKPKDEKKPIFLIFSLICDELHGAKDESPF